jgi:hypothetical protein
MSKHTGPRSQRGYLRVPGAWRRLPWGALAFTGLVIVLGGIGWLLGFVWHIIGRGFAKGDDAADAAGWAAEERLGAWDLSED